MWDQKGPVVVRGSQSEYDYDQYDDYDDYHDQYDYDCDQTGEWGPSTWERARVNVITKVKIAKHDD